MMRMTSDDDLDYDDVGDDDDLDDDAVVQCNDDKNGINKIFI